MSKRNSIIRSFEYAGNGVREAFRSEPNFRVHIVIGTASIILELINTAIEKVVDKISPHYSPLAKIAKDVSAAAVLISAFAAIAVGILLFLPDIRRFLSFLIR